MLKLSSPPRIPLDPSLTFIMRIAASFDIPEKTKTLQTLC
jgi:hypothetical protein